MLERRANRRMVITPRLTNECNGSDSPQDCSHISCSGEKVRSRQIEAVSCEPSMPLPFTLNTTDVDFSKFSSLTYPLQVINSCWILNAENISRCHCSTCWGTPRCSGLLPSAANGFQGR